MHANWKVALPMLLSDLVYWYSKEGSEVYKLSDEIKDQVKRRLNNIVANVGREEVRELCAEDGFYLNDEWFDTLEKE